MLLCRNGDIAFEIFWGSCQQSPRSSHSGEMKIARANLMLFDMVASLLGADRALRAIFSTLLVDNVPATEHRNQKMRS